MDSQTSPDDYEFVRRCRSCSCSCNNLTDKTFGVSSGCCAMDNKKLVYKLKEKVWELEDKLFDKECELEDVKIRLDKEVKKSSKVCKIQHQNQLANEQKKYYRN
jgi:hypothetical protein